MAPELDLLGEIAELSTQMATTHSEQFAAEMGMSAADFKVDAEAIKIGFGIVDDEVETVTYRDLQKRRETIRKRWEK